MSPCGRSAGLSFLLTLWVPVLPAAGQDITTFVTADDGTLLATDVYPSGHSVLVIEGIQRARMRCGDDNECLLTPGEPVEITVDLWSTAIVFNTGHRIRISVSGSNSPRFEVNPNHGGDLDGDDPPIIAHPDLLFGLDHPSRLELPTPAWRPRRPSGREGGG